MRTLLSVACLACLAACDKPLGDTPPSFGGGPIGNAPPPGMGKPPPAGPGRGPACPAEEPLPDSNCQTSTPCVYGNDVDNRCNAVYTCEGGRYVLSPVTTCSGRCPKDFSAITAGGACADATMGCTYLEGTCACMDDDADAGETADAASEAPRKGLWKCVLPPAAPTCPLARPPVDSECVRPMTCDYGSCELSMDLAVQCTGLRWIKTAATCP